MFPAIRQWGRPVWATQPSILCQQLQLQWGCSCPQQCELLTNYQFCDQNEKKSIFLDSWSWHCRFASKCWSDLQFEVIPMKSYYGLLIICTLLLLQVTMIRTSSLMTMMPMVMVWMMMDLSSFLAGLKLTEQFCLTHCIFKSYIIVVKMGLLNVISMSIFMAVLWWVKLNDHQILLPLNTNNLSGEKLAGRWICPETRISGSGRGEQHCHDVSTS